MLLRSIVPPSRELKFEQPFYSLTIWRDVPAMVITFSLAGTLSAKDIIKKIKKSPTNYLVFRNFEVFGRRAVAFMRNTHKFVQFETEGWYPALVAEAMNFVARGVLIYQYADINFHPTAVELRNKSLKYIKKRPYLVRTDASIISHLELRHIRADMKRKYVPAYYWDILNYGGDVNELTKWFIGNDPRPNHSIFNPHKETL